MYCHLFTVHSVAYMWTDIRTRRRVIYQLFGDAAAIATVDDGGRDVVNVRMMWDACCVVGRMAYIIVTTARDTPVSPY